MEKDEEVEQSTASLKGLFKDGKQRLFINPSKMHNALGEASENFSISKKAKKGAYNRCHHPWFQMVVDFKGNVVGCCRDLRSEYQVGNILDTENINTGIWNGKKMRDLRANLRRKKPENVNICAKCDLPYGESYAGKTITGKIRRFLF